MTTVYIGGGFWSINGDSLTSLAKWMGGTYTDSCVVTAGIGDYPEPVAASLFPNPADQQVKWKSESILSSGTISFHDPEGRLELRKDSCTGHEIILDISTLKPGIYFLRITDLGNLIDQQRLMVLH